MVVQTALGQETIAAPHGLGDAAMFLDPFIGDPVGVLQDGQAHARLDHERGVDANEAATTAQRHEVFMKGHIGVAHGGVIASDRCILHLRDFGEQVLTGSDVVSAHEHFAGGRFHGGAQHVHIANLGIRHFDHKQAAVANADQQTLLRQPLHRFAQRTPADTEFAGEFGLAELRPGRYSAVRDRIPQLAGDDRRGGFLDDGFQ